MEPLEADCQPASLLDVFPMRSEPTIDGLRDFCFPDGVKFELMTASGNCPFCALFNYLNVEMYTYVTIYALIHSAITILTQFSIGIHYQSKAVLASAVK